MRHDIMTNLLFTLLGHYSGGNSNKALHIEAKVFLHRAQL